ncbi:uncharacterized protein LOC133356484 [Lethenteron reissneri]|uniref:uncharacterized protein LOC133356484 n=1 Tax=Lethenteron reissneri TaxID=7753 RepID=UPI002AB702AD|nr:uncharacterized protein LOC133356484 [Lethenteron reissneri]
MAEDAQETTFVDCGGLKFLLGLLKHHACQGLMLRFESRNTLRFAATALKNLSTVPELKSCFHQERAADVLACYLDVPDAPCKLSALNTLARIATEQDLDIICNAQGAISLLTDMVNRPSYKKYTALENILYKSKSLVKTLTIISITTGIRRKTEGASSSLDKKVLEELIPKLREKLKVEVEKRDYTLEWGDIAVHPTRRSVQKWPKARDGRIYVPYKVSVAFYNGDVKKIEEAALEFEKKTCVRFIPRSSQTDYIYIHAWDGNWSFLGRQGGDQALSLEPGKVTKGVVLHELMHALGFHHEHCRSDRDDHVWVLSHNVKPEYAKRIRSANIDDPASSLHAVWERLEECYGSPETIEKALFKKLQNFAKISVLTDGKKTKVKPLLVALLVVVAVVAVTVASPFLDSELLSEWEFWKEFHGKAPQPEHTISRLELCGAILATEVAELILDEFDVKLDAVKFYTDNWVDAIVKTTPHEHNLRTPYDYSSVTHYGMYVSRHPDSKVMKYSGGQGQAGVLLEG